jgi:hypothetical protein
VSSKKFAKVKEYDPCVLSMACFFILYGSWPAVHSATRLSPVLAYSQRLLLDAATLNAPPASSCEVVGDQSSYTNLEQKKGDRSRPLPLKHEAYQCCKIFDKKSLVRV